MSQLHTTFVEHDAEISSFDTTVEIPRGADADTTFIEDTTAYFECLQMGDGDTCTVKNARGEQILIHSADEVVVEPSAAIFSSVSQDDEEPSVFEANNSGTVEVPRGYGTESITVDENICGGDQPSASCEVKKSESQKVANFLNNLRRDPEWARSLPYVKLNATVPKDLQLDLISHLFLNVNHRPQYMLVLSKEMNMAFEPSEIAMQRTLFRLNCRNPLHSLKSLIRLLIHETSIRAYIEVKYSEVLGELIHKDSKIRAKTDRIKDFCKYEEQGRALGMRFLTTFSCRSIADPQRSLEIRYYDEMKNGSRVVYLHMDHQTVRTHRLKFGGIASQTTFEVDGEMVPVSQSYPPVHDLIELIKKLSSRST
ncbi:hypothetical protein Q1695_001027 [Nippostrongylus brasiliensis]|nr:hypothetical protein Q1695_001022 [Nippostrongylus brasiliensis]WKY16016.1 hypothetical protein Q1695_001025 [Nippostrongylus brasiliensis]WKY16019.1 hypothetical protein Q1695_001027 [Nippostrongylus brasiliensis]